MSKKPSAAVIGAGLGGLAADIKLKEAGFDDVTILEKAAKADEWNDRLQAYLGTSVANFPNMFVLHGSSTNLGHNSITFMPERQVEHTVKAPTELYARWRGDERNRKRADPVQQSPQTDLAKAT